MDLRELGGKVTYYTSLMTLLLNMRTTASIGRVEQQMDNAGGHVRDIKSIVNGIAAAQMSQGNQDGSVMTAYTDDGRSQ